MDSNGFTFHHFMTVGATYKGGDVVGYDMVFAIYRNGLRERRMLVGKNLSLK